jgi:hypothetical protein
MQQDVGFDLGFYPASRIAVLEHDDVEGIQRLTYLYGQVQFPLSLSL